LATELADEPCHYGTTVPLNTLNPIKANFQHWRMLAKDSLTTRLWRDKIALWFKPTGWRPQDCKKKSATASELQKTGCKAREKYDPQTTKIITFYSGISFLCIVLLAIMFIFLAPSLSAIKLVVGTIIIVFSLVAINDFLEGKKRFFWLELVRLPAMFWLANVLWFSTSSTRIIDTIVIDKPPAEVLAYASSPGLWSQWHPQSSTIVASSQHPFIKGETFDEQIETPLGQNHLRWQVVQNTSDSWLAQAQNITNGAKIKLQYRVHLLYRRIAVDKTVFERTLDYTLPNVALVAINALYFKSKVEQKSEDALQRLQTAMMKIPAT